MTDKERIEILEKEVAFLKEGTTNKRLSNSWLTLGKHIEEQLLVAFNASSMSPRIAQCKSSICCLVGKSFCKNSVLALSTEEVEEARVLVDYILDFMKVTRNRNTVKNPVRGYERGLMKEVNRGEDEMH